MSTGETTRSATRGESAPVFLTPHLDVVGGTERQVRLLRAAFALRGIEVPVVTRRRPDGRPPEAPWIIPFDHPAAAWLRTARATRNGLRRWTQLGRADTSASAPAHPDEGVEASRSNHPIRRFVDRALARRIADLTVNALDAPVAVHLHGTFHHPTCVGARAAAARLERPFVVKIANEPGRVFAQLSNDREAFDAIASADALLAVNAGTERELRRLGLGPRILRIPNAVEMSAEPPALPDDGPIVCLGTLKRQKGIDVLLRAYGALPRTLRMRHPLRIVGDGSERLELERLAESVGVGDSVRFVGTSHAPGIELANASLFVLPSRWEGMPNALLEAMAEARPCIATDIDGCRDLIVDGASGRLVPPDDSVALAHALESALTDRRTARAHGSAARRFVEEHHAPERIVDALCDAYRSLGG